MGRWKQAWSEEDLGRLKVLAGTKPIALIAKELGRTSGTVLAKAIEQKLPVICRTKRQEQ
ncbi:hypothetical protein ABIF65_003449 [Bradyrhizobium japonicum]|uniref:hypothetical protein n=1 Tax=Bradyrhizobium TaxID=374 RepID=UPI0003F894F4|nr:MULTISPECIES: hypothetical protein [Bradyrhizobium]MBR0878325.1 hypothetical protein [Bradyrhizobium liaoningense]MBR0940338.1 hypothetical protein [Bradyrhizobium liaoningense]MBR0997642.1 hypothetical protein [Bradyrhizobium liaoningense]MBR1026775.1 hypothetical protein [Bradyrhizobium liaoningense]MBR1065498.1 hypothetical protein [Bradyrhizobium liaoningense]